MRGTTRIVALIAATSCLVGIAVGVGWALIAPRPQMVVRTGRLVDVVAYPESYAAADLILGALCIVAGVCMAVIFLTLVFRDEPDAALVGLIIGGGLGSVIAWRTGAAIGTGQAIGGGDGAGSAEGQVVAGALQMRSPGVLVFWAICACVVGLVVGIVRRRRRRAAEVASDAVGIPERS